MYSHISLSDMFPGKPGSLQGIPDCSLYLCYEQIDIEEVRKDP